MDDADLDFSNPEVLTGPYIGDGPLSSCSVDSLFDYDEYFQDNHHHACTHTHTCNPPGPDLSHTHTCLHVHTKIVPAPSDETSESAEKDPSKKRTSGNRVAVRKYREKKKAHTASLEDEVVHLRAVNQQLRKRLQGQVALEAEVARLRCLLVDLRGRIEGEIGSFPYQRPVNRAGGGDLAVNMAQVNLMGGAHIVNSCNVRCGENGTSNGQGFEDCEMGNIQCAAGLTSGSKDCFGCEVGSAMPAGCTTAGHKMRGARAGKKIGACAETKG